MGGEAWAYREADVEFLVGEHVVHEFSSSLIEQRDA